MLNNNSYYHLGIDGGGTQCRARLYSPKGELLACAGAGPMETTAQPSLQEPEPASYIFDTENHTPCVLEFFEWPTKPVAHR